MVTFRVIRGPQPALPPPLLSSASAPSLATTRSPQPAPLTPFFATLTASPQLAENSPTLSPAFATLTRPVTPKSCVCHSYRKSPGVGTSDVLQRPLSASSFHFSSSLPSNSFPFTLFRTLLPGSKCHPQSFQPLPHSLRKTPGVGGLATMATHQTICLCRFGRFRYNCRLLGEVVE
jgi:hypothetical protein